MKKYIILMLNIHRMGGTQTYIASKVKYLRDNGWDVYVFYGDMKNNKCAVPQLFEFNDNSIAGLTTPPNYLLPSIRQRVLKEIISIVGIDDYSEIIVETLTSVLSLWGELVAEALSAKHICFLCDENFRQPGQVYIEHLNFFDFKHQRRELAGIHDNSLVKLFDGYKNIPPEERYTLVAYEGEVVQDVKNEIVEHIERCDWNICYIGRMDKGYVDNIVNDMVQLALKYKDKNIQIIFVGNADKKKKYINKLYKNIINVKLIFLGNLVPIPRILYSKSDVIIAGAAVHTLRHMKVSRLLFRMQEIFWRMVYMVMIHLTHYITKKIQNK